jgi:nucleolar pre-ribosomal-associated protein 1
MLYRYEQSEDLPSGQKSVADIAHEFLILACTSMNAGVLVRQSGFYPRGVDPEDILEGDSGDAYIDLGLDSIEWMGSFSEKVPVRNTILSEFIQNLRPWASTKQGELLLSIFKAAPELFADYFYGKKDFSFEPKLTATWMGYSAFVFSALQLPVPQYFGYNSKYPRLPPPPAVALENILPQSLSQKVLTRCLIQQNHSLVTFFAIRILCVAFSKLQNVLKMYQEAASGLSSIWTQAANELVEDFCQRCPPIKEVIVAYRRMTSTGLMQREAATKLLVLYYEVVPRIALDAKFGVSAALAETLRAVEDATLTGQERMLRTMELENLFMFAHFSPGIRWFSKTQQFSISPFVAMLKLYAEAPSGLPLLKLRSVLEAVVQENQIFQTQTAISALDSFVLRLREINESHASSAIYKFLDDCISRCSAKPIKYIFALEELHSNLESSHDGIPISLLSLAILEQWPFMIKSTEDRLLPEIATFFARYFATSIRLQEDKKAVKMVVQKIVEETPTNSVAQKIIEKSKKLVDGIPMPGPKIISTPKNPLAQTGSVEEEQQSKILLTLSSNDDGPIDDHKSLTKWTTKDVEEVIEEGHAAALVMLLSSEHLSVRKEAVTNISKFAAKLKDSSFEEKEQIWLLLSEVVETAKLIVDQEPLATVIVAFASYSIVVLQDPLHYLYVKINKFLSGGPTWKLDRIPLMHKILNEEPSLDDGHYSEMHWLLSCLISGLRTQADMALYRNGRVFENLLSIYNSANLATGIRDKILRILFRASSIGGGSTTLITRFSTMTWIQAQVALGGGMPLKVLMGKILESCDQKRIRIWSKGIGNVKGDIRRFESCR